eukprot:Rhum_TRINITY_DN14614_c12_g1::Rhum_TRINITY_DN14614_c12_g1_i1::g.104400::m.104400
MRVLVDHRRKRAIRCRNEAVLFRRVVDGVVLPLCDRRLVPVSGDGVAAHGVRDDLPGPRRHHTHLAYLLQRCLVLQTVLGFPVSHRPVLPVLSIAVELSPCGDDPCSLRDLRAQLHLGQLLFAPPRQLPLAHLLLQALRKQPPLVQHVPVPLVCERRQRDPLHPARVDTALDEGLPAHRPQQAQPRRQVVRGAVVRLVPAARVRIRSLRAATVVALGGVGAASSHLRRGTLVSRLTVDVGDLRPVAKGAWRRRGHARARQRRRLARHVLPHRLVGPQVPQLRRRRRRRRVRCKEGVGVQRRLRLLRVPCRPQKRLQPRRRRRRRLVGPARRRRRRRLRCLGSGGSGRLGDPRRVPRRRHQRVHILLEASVLSSVGVVVVVAH